MKAKTLRNDFLLLLTALIWGTGFVAQSLGMEHLKPFTFNGIRFALGSLSLLPLIFFRARKQKPQGTAKEYLYFGALAGIFLFCGASLQQFGIVHTTAGNAGFITGIYVLLVPILGMLWKQRTAGRHWIGALLALVGLYFLSVKAGISIGKGDLLVLISAFFWAAHVLIIGHGSPKLDPIILSAVQFFFCGVASLALGIPLELPSLHQVQLSVGPLLYGGLMSVGIAYTLQVVAQKEAPPSHAAIILSLEGAFAALGGWLILSEGFQSREILGCALMFTGMIVAQIPWEIIIKKQKDKPRTGQETT